MERSATAFTAADRIGQLNVKMERRRGRARDAREARVGAVTVWSGRVGAQLAPEVWEFLRGDDAELLPFDLQATLLHAERLHAAGILDDAELAEVTEKLGAIDEIAEDDEDVHSSIERQLGEVGRKIHAGRSRNDQVAAAFRLYVGAACAEADAALAALRARDPRPRRGRGADGDARVHPSAAGAAGDGRPPPPRVGRDA